MSSCAATSTLNNLNSEEHTTAPVDTFGDEDNDEGYIRRCHLITKGGGLPIVSCSYVSYNSENGKRRNGVNHHQNSHMVTEPTYVSNDGSQDSENNDCIYSGNPQQSGGAASSHVSALRNNDQSLTSSSPNIPTVFVKNDKVYTSYEQWFDQDKYCATYGTADTASDDEHSSTSSSSDSCETNYDPLFLDDPTIRSATSRKVMHLPGLISSTVPFIRKRELESDLNEQFREKHPNVKLSLSKIRSLKKKMLRVCFPPTPFVSALMFNNTNLENTFVECSTIAMAVVFLEKLILKNVAVKQNRRVIAAACLFLAFKFNYEGGGSNMEKNFSQFWDAVEENLSVSRKQVMKLEFQVFAWLDFDLNVPLNQLYPHLKRLLNMANGLNAIEYMGEELFNQYIASRMGAHHHQHQSSAAEEYHHHHTQNSNGNSHQVVSAAT